MASRLRAIGSIPILAILCLISLSATSCMPPRPTYAGYGYLIIAPQDVMQEMEDFALRRPQKRQAQAAVDAAENRLALARLDLERTVVHAPFNALVLDESVEIGQLVDFCLLTGLLAFDLIG